MIHRLLIVTADPAVSDLLHRCLSVMGVMVHIACCGEEGLRLAMEQEWSLVFLDSLLPSLGGLDLCRMLRCKGSHVPIMILSDFASSKDKAKGIRLGADDYMAKPLDPAELRARTEALLRRSPWYRLPETRLHAADLVFDLEQRRVQRAGRVIDLTAKELALLELLMATPGRVLTRQRILAAVWGNESDPMTNIVDVYLRRLRLKIDKGASRPLLRTVRGIGYSLDDGGDARCDATPVAATPPTGSAPRLAPGWLGRREVRDPAPI